MIIRHALGLSPFVDIPDFRVFATTPNSRVQRKDASMSTDTKHIVRMALNVYEAAIRADRSEDKAQHRAELVVKFEQLCTDMGKICTERDRPVWEGARSASQALLGKAVEADLARSGTMVNAGAIAALTTAVSVLGAVLGLKVADAATATDAADDHARVAIEGEVRHAAE